MKQFRNGDTVWIVPRDYLVNGIFSRTLVSFNEKVTRVSSGKTESEYHSDNVFESKSLAIQEAQRRRDIEVMRLRSRIIRLQNIDFHN